MRKVQNSFIYIGLSYYFCQLSLPSFKILDWELSSLHIGGKFFLTYGTDVLPGLSFALCVSPKEIVRVQFKNY